MTLHLRIRSTLFDRYRCTTSLVMCRCDVSDLSRTNLDDLAHIVYRRIRITLVIAYLSLLINQILNSTNLYLFFYNDVLIPIRTESNRSLARLEPTFTHRTTVVPIVQEAGFKPTFHNMLWLLSLKYSCRSPTLNANRLY